MHDDFIFGFVWGCIIGGTIMLLIMVGLLHSRIGEVRTKAVEKGNAEWVVDNKGNTEFKWIDHSESKE